MEWIKEGVNYWENPNCPIEYLQVALVQLVNEVEGIELSANHFNNINRNHLIQKIAFYEDVVDK
ncbi:hypothetical protein [Paraliobacillus ryukyuensis]|uniref:hypothetical protein n=1 Tax=Paraliobacillus ryukyuensis TaxID=200904 RepID=UPI0009A6E15D|nr:hypothetical protein [Paraliobacillus ryukyuensis]